MDDAVKASYAAARRDFPESTFVLLLDPLDISKLELQVAISGTVYRLLSDGARVEIARDVRLQRKDYRILYFDEVPLSLAPEAQ